MLKAMILALLLAGCGGGGDDPGMGPVAPPDRQACKRLQESDETRVCTAVLQTVAKRVATYENASETSRTRTRLHNQDASP